jgi:hypothetical protein
MLKKSLPIVAALLLIVSFVRAVPQETRVIVSDSITVAPGEIKWYTFDVDRDGGHIIGNFRAQGGSHNDIRVLIMSAEEIENYKNGNNTETYYDSGKKTVGRFNVNVPGGSYCLVFDNKFSVVSNKAVRIYAEVQPNEYQPRNGREGNYRGNTRVTNHNR